MAVFSVLRSNWFWIALNAVLYSAAVVIHGSASYDRGYAIARAEGDAALLNLHCSTPTNVPSPSKTAWFSTSNRSRAPTRPRSNCSRYSSNWPTPDTNSRSESLMSRPYTGRRLMSRLLLSLAVCSLVVGCATTTPLSAPICPPLEPLVVPPSLKKRPAPPPALTPNYWKAASLPPTSWLTPRTTAAGRSATPPSSTSCSICRKGSSPIWTL